MPALHLAPCHGFGGFDWPASLPAWWLVAAVEGRPGLEYAPSLFDALLDRRCVWDGRRGNWQPAEADRVRPVVWRAGLAIVASPGPALRDVASGVAAWREHETMSALRARYGKPAPTPPPSCPARPLLEEPSRPEAAAISALAATCGPFLLCRIGDMSHGLHGILIGPWDEVQAGWLVALPGVEVTRYPSTRELPVT